MKRGEPTQPFASPGEALEHHGVKGMKWGVRKEEDSGSGSTAGRLPTDTPAAKQTAATNASLKLYMAEAQKMGHTSSEAALMKDKQAWLNKSAPDDSSAAAGKIKPVTVSGEHKKLSPEQKKLLKNVAIGVGVAGGLYLANKKVGEALGYDSVVKAALKGQMKGEPVSAKQFNTLVLHSQMKTWAGGNYFKGDALTREGFELPAGHTFHRLSQFAETDFTKPTYSVTNIDDWNRYLTNFRHEKGPNATFAHVQWNLTKPIKVPSTHEVLTTMQDVLKSEGKMGTEKDALHAYQAISGGGWIDARSENLVKALKAKGFGAVVDEMDAGVIGDKPLVFFDHGAATPKKSTPLTAKQLEAAEQQVKELLNRKT